MDCLFVQIGMESENPASFLDVDHNRRPNSATSLPMLQLRPSCESCDTDLPADSLDARICSFECTFCTPCARDVLQGVCPNCGGELVARPRRPASKLAKFPASTERVFSPPGGRDAA
jgi:uncharacterized protein